MGLPFRSLTPGGKVEPGIKLVISTKKERQLIPFDRVLCIEELGEDIPVVKGKIISALKGKRKGDSLVIGVDPGERIGLVVFYLQDEIYADTLNSILKAEARISKLVQSSTAKRKMIRIGNGKLDIARRIASDLAKKFGPDVEIEIVDERGTSALSRTSPNRKELRDQRSARLIAMRAGKRYVM